MFSGALTRHRFAARRQRGRLHRWVARARLERHERVGGSTSI